MSVAPVAATTDTAPRSRSQSILYGWIPQSWYAVDNGRDRGERNIDRERERNNDDLDDTRSFGRRYDDHPPFAPKVQVPFGVVVTITIYLIGQLVAGVWWAATLQSNLQHEIADRAKEEQRLWDGIQAYRAEVNALRIDIARVSSSQTRRTNQKSEDE